MAVAIEAHFYVVNGKAYSSYLSFECFWRRYLEVFDSVLVFSRVKLVDKVPFVSPVIIAGINLSLDVRHFMLQFVNERKRTCLKGIERDNVQEGWCYENYARIQSELDGLSILDTGD